MAYLKDYARTCEREGCNKKATRQLFGHANSLYGTYCAHCAAVRLIELNKAEEACFSLSNKEQP